MSYRKKHYPPKPEPRERQAAPPEVTFDNSGISRDIPTSHLTSGLPYQRPVLESDVDDLIRRWDDRLLTPLVVSFRDGKFNVVDGQHRMAAMRKMAGGGDLVVHCLVYTGLTYEDEAELYYKLDRSKGRLTLAQSTKALVESGKDAEVLAIKQLLAYEGFEWALGKKFGKEYEVLATRATIKAYRLLGNAAFSRMFALMRDAWRGDPRSLSAYVLSGMALFLKTYETELNDAIFIRQMSRVDPDEIIRRGKLDYSTNRSALRYARVILDKYNGRRTRNCLPYRLG